MENLLFWLREMSEYKPVILALCVALMAVSIVLSYVLPRRSARRRRKQALRVLKTLAHIEHDGQKFSYLRKIDPFTFEELLLTAYERRGHKIRRNRRYTGDGGIDGQVEINGEWHLVQAKRYSSAINPAHVQTFAELCARKGQKGLFIHTGRTGQKSHGHKGQHVQIISGDGLLRML